MNIDKNSFREVLAETFDNDPRFDFITILDDNSELALNRFYSGISKKYINLDVIQAFHNSLNNLVESEYLPPTAPIPITWKYLIESHLIKTLCANAINELDAELLRIKEKEEERKLFSKEQLKHGIPIPREFAQTRALTLDVDSDLLEAKYHNKRALVYKAYTGAGKSLGLDMWICNTNPNEQRGIILCNDNFEAQEHYNRIKEWNPEMAKRCFIFNTAIENREDYYKAKEDLNIFSQYNWVFCYQGRLLESSVDVLTKVLIDLDKFKTVTDKLFSNVKTYIFSDECITCSPEFRIYINSLITINEVTDNLLIKYANDVNHLNADLEKKLNNYFTDLSTRLLSNNLSDTDKAIVKIFSSNSIKSVEFQLNVYMARYKTFLAYVKNRPDDFLRQYEYLKNNYKKDNCRDYLSFHPCINEVAINHDLIIFDATASIDYGFDNPYFYIKTIAEQPKNLFDFYLLDSPFIKKDTLSKDEVDEFYDKLNIKFKPYSIIICTNSPWSVRNNKYTHLFKSKAEKESYNVIKLNEYLNRTLGPDHHCMVTFFNSGNMLGRNIFSECKNVYILGNYYLADDGLHSMQSATLNLNFSNAHKWVREIVQGSGRGEGRNHKSSIPDSQSGVMSYYFTSDVNYGLINSLIDYYGIRHNRIKWSNREEFDKWVEIYCDYLINGPKVVTNEFRYNNLKDGLLEIRGNGKSNIAKFKYLANRWYLGDRRINVNDLVTEGLISKPEVSRLSTVKDICFNFGLDGLVVYSRRSEW